MQSSDFVGSIVVAILFAVLYNAVGVKKMVRFSVTWAINEKLFSVLRIQ